MLEAYTGSDVLFDGQSRGEHGFVPLERLLELRRETEVNLLFTRPSPRVVVHRARKFVRRLRRDPGEALGQAARLGRAVLGGPGLRG